MKHSNLDEKTAAATKQELKRGVGQRLRQFRKKKGLSQGEFAAYFDIGRANYSRIEKGEVFPNVFTLNVLKKHFDISLNWLLSNEGDMYVTAEEEQLNLSHVSQDMKDLIYHMENVPMLRHAVLSFFLEYKFSNQELVAKILKQVEPDKEEE